MFLICDEQRCAVTIVANVHLNACRRATPAKRKFGILDQVLGADAGNESDEGKTLTAFSASITFDWLCTCSALIWIFAHYIRSQ